MSSVPGSSGSQDRFDAGDALRACAAIGVLVFHVWASVRIGFALQGDTGAFTALGPLETWAGHLDVGLYLFFVLSGYLLGRPFLAAILGDRRFPDVRRYARNRFLRIVPAFWVAWTLILIVWGTHGGGAEDILGVYASLQDYVALQVTAGQFVQGWTVGVEIMFYVALPAAAVVLAWLVRRSGPAAWRTVVCFLALAFTAGLVVRALNTDGARYLHSFPAMAFAFVPGLALAAVEVRYARGWRGAAWGSAAAWGMLALSFALYAAFVAFKPAGVITNSVLDVMTAAAFVAGPLVLQWTTGRNWALFGNRVSLWLGARSYSIYLYHVAVVFALNDLLLRQPGARAGFVLGVALTLAITCVIADLSFRFVEQPALALRSGRPHQAAEVVPAATIDRVAAARALLATYEHVDQGGSEAELAEGERSA